MPRQLLFNLLILVLIAGLAACSGESASRQIAAYPQNPEPAPLVEEHPVTYDAFLALQVADANQAASQAAWLAESLGGYTIRSDYWLEDSWTYASLDLAVPAGRFEDLRRELYRLGTLLDESGTEHPMGGPVAIYPPPLSHLALRLRSAVSPHPPSYRSDIWNPARTFQRALQVSAWIFHFLVDGLIWLLVIAGPFVALVWAGLALFRRLRRS